MLTPDQIRDLKKQLSQQIAHLPEDQKIEAQEQIDELSPEALESMVNQQKDSKPNQSVLRMIIDGSIPSKRIDSNKSALAVLDIRPVSKGHTIIIPKIKIKANEQPPTTVFTLAKKIARRMKTKLKPKGIEIQTETKFEEQIVNVIPCYDKPLSVTSPRYEANEKELSEMQKLLESKIRQKVIRPKKPETYKDTNRPIIKRRIP